MTAVQLEKYRAVRANRLTSFVSGPRTMTKKLFSRTALEMKERTSVAAADRGFPMNRYVPDRLCLLEFFWKFFGFILCFIMNRPL